MTTLHLRRLGLALALPGVLLLSACGVRADFTIHDNDTVDYGMTLWDDTGSGNEEIGRASCRERV